MRLLSDRARTFVLGDGEDTTAGVSIEVTPVGDGFGWRLALVNDGVSDRRIRSCGLVVRSRSTDRCVCS